jgi:hypothetical protein
MFMESIFTQKALLKRGKQLFSLFIPVLFLTSCKDDSKPVCETYNEAYVDVTNNSSDAWYLKWPSDTAISMGIIPAGETKTYKFNSFGNANLIFKEENGAGRIEMQVSIQKCQHQAVTIP